MPIKSVILDRDGTLYNIFTGELQDGVTKMIDRLKGLGIEVFVASNEDRDAKVERLIGLPRDSFFYRSECGTKGSHGYVEAACSASGCKLNELVYLGDSELDMREAAGCRVALFNAEWSNPNYRYGLGVDTPADFADTIEQYFVKSDIWYFAVDEKDPFDRLVMSRGLLDPDTCKNKGITHLLKTRDIDLKNNKYYSDLAVNLILHLLASIYLEGIHLIREPNKQKGFMKPLWCIYPGSTGDTHPILQLFEKFTARLLTMTYGEGVIQRHTPTPEKSHRLRMRGEAPDLAEQFNTVNVNSASLSKVSGNIVIVVDDFSTGSHAFETARNLLYACGAKKVVSVSVGKYGRPPKYTIFTPINGVTLPKRGGVVNPAVKSSDFVQKTIYGTVNAKACDRF